MIRVLIADDHSIVREGLSRILALEPDIKVALTVSNAAEAIDAVIKEPVDVVLLDISMPGRSGLEVIPDLHRICPEIKVLMLSMYPEKLMAVRALKAGASGYMTKDADTDEIVSAIRIVNGGRRYITPQVAEAMMDELGQPADAEHHSALSNRELQILQLFARGKKAAGIAEDLNISPRTVGTYRTRILDKLRMKTTAELIRYALEHKLLD